MLSSVFGHRGCHCNAKSLCIATAAAQPPRCSGTLRPHSNFPGCRVARGCCGAEDCGAEQPQRFSSAIFRATAPSGMGTWRALTPFYAKLCLCHHAISRQHADRQLAKMQSCQVYALKLSHEDIRQVPHTAFRSGKLNKPYSILVHPSEMEQDRTSRGMAHCKYVGGKRNSDSQAAFKDQQLK